MRIISSPMHPDRWNDEIICARCRTRLAVDETDIITYQQEFGPTDIGVRCPVCQGLIKFVETISSDDYHWLRLKLGLEGRGVRP